MDVYSNAADGFQRASFQPDGGAKVDFPITRLEWQGELRHHVHEYLHADGGDLETQGRRIYEVRFDALFYDSFHTKGYPKLYPFGLDTLVRAWEAGKSGILVVPSPILGFLQAKCVNWKGSFEAKIRSGEMVNLAFKEDRADDFKFQALIDLSAAALPALHKRLQLEADVLRPKPNVFDKINAAVNAALQLRDRADLYVAYVVSKLEYVADLCSEADNLISLKDPAYAQLADALHDVWAAALRAADDALGKRTPMQRFRVPMAMSIGQVSAHLYRGDASRGPELMQLNADLDDPFRVPAGTTLQYYPAG